jgi:hypothetical protein
MELKSDGLGTCVFSWPWSCSSAQLGSSTVRTVLTDRTPELPQPQADTCTLVRHTHMSACITASCSMGLGAPQRVSRPLPLWDSGEIQVIINFICFRQHSVVQDPTYCGWDKVVSTRLYWILVLGWWNSYWIGPTGLACKWILCNSPVPQLAPPVTCWSGVGPQVHLSNRHSIAL